MNGLLSKILRQAPSTMKKVAQSWDNKHAKMFIEVEQIHPEVIFFKGMAFEKKPHFKDYGPAMNAAKEAGAKVPDIAAAIGCAISTVYKAMRDAKGK